MFFRFFEYRDQIVSTPSRAIANKIAAFENANLTSTKLYEEAVMALDDITDLVTNSNSQQLQTLTVFGGHLQNYLENATALKTPLAEMALSEEIFNAFQSFELTLQDLQTLSLDYVNTFYNLGEQWEAMNWLIYSETSTQPFYQRLSEDLQLYLANLSDPENSEFYSIYFRDLLDMSVEEFNSLSTEQLFIYMNADFPSLEWDELLEEMREFFRDVRDEPNVSTYVLNSAGKFSEALADVQQSLLLFLQGNEMDLKFYRWVTSTLQPSVVIAQLLTSKRSLRTPHRSPIRVSWGRAMSCRLWGQSLSHLFVLHTVYV